MKADSNSSTKRPRAPNQVRPGAAVGHLPENPAEWLGLPSEILMRATPNDLVRAMNAMGGMRIAWLRNAARHVGSIQNPPAPVPPPSQEQDARNRLGSLLLQNGPIAIAIALAEAIGELTSYHKEDPLAAALESLVPCLLDRLVNIQQTQDAAIEAARTCDVLGLPMPEGALS